jgi:hypothetical protein
LGLNAHHLENARAPKIVTSGTFFGVLLSCEPEMRFLVGKSGALQNVRSLTIFGAEAATHEQHVAPENR